MAQFDVSIIIVSYNTETITKTCLDTVFRSLEHAAFTWEVIVVDNKSTDRSPDMLKAYRKRHTSQFQLIESQENLGFGHANNRAVETARGTYILLLNSDTEVIDNAIEKLYLYYKDHEHEAQFLGGKLLNKDMSPQPSAAPFFSLPVIFAFLFLKGDALGITRRSPDHITDVGWVSGACIFTAKKYYEELGGFDEGIFMYMEEVDLLYRARLRGYKTRFYPSAQFIHLGSASSNKTYPIIQAYRGFIYFYKKHHSPLALLFLIGMLKLKAVVALLIGFVLRKPYLIETYAQAYKVAQMDGR